MCLSRRFFIEHLSDIEQVSIKLRNTKLKVNAVKSSFGNTKIDYLGCVVNREGIKNQPTNIEAILKIES